MMREDVNLALEELRPPVGQQNHWWFVRLICVGKSVIHSLHVVYIVFNEYFNVEKRKEVSFLVILGLNCIPALHD